MLAVGASRKLIRRGRDMRSVMLFNAIGRDISVSRYLGRAIKFVHSPISYSRLVSTVVASYAMLHP